MVNKYTCRYRPYSQSELRLVIFQYEIGDGFYKKQTNIEYNRPKIKLNINLKEITAAHKVPPAKVMYANGALNIN